ncbi:MAG: protein-L-isoaspartate O-methyltransferase [Gammaproteobacteria bacterium]|nr:protein-L-isoaspartate O-methyltransferase [Gammaproteobacteria bacterium]MDH5692831.1 protein-L-isoaspartate O-methyltransferase [Gammaproteobacteria bacterium]
MAEIDLKQARFNMVEQQIRTWEVLDEEVLELLHEMPREEFVPKRYKNLAYSDIPIPLSNGQEMMHPKLEAHALQAVAPKSTDKVLEIGTGSGHLTAMLAKKANHVYSVEIFPDLMKSAAANLKNHGITNVTLEEGDASQGWNDHGPYDAIVVTGALPRVPEIFKHSLTLGGRMFIVVGKSPIFEAMLITRVDENQWEQKSLFETELPLLVNGEEPPQFEF